MMKKIMMTMLATLMISTSAVAQSNENGTSRPKFDRAEMVKHQTERMVKEYGLSEAQGEKLLALNEKYAGKMRMSGFGGPRGPRGGQNGERPKRVDGQTGASSQQNGAQAEKRERPTREQMEARMKEEKANREAYNAELREIMSADQYSRFEADQKKRMERGPRNGRDGRGQQ